MDIHKLILHTEVTYLTMSETSREHREAIEMNARPREVVSDTEGRISRVVMSTPFGMSQNERSDFSASSEHMSESAALEVYFLQQVRKQLDPSVNIEVITTSDVGGQACLQQRLADSGAYTFKGNPYQSTSKRWMKDYVLLANKGARLIQPAGMERTLGQVKELPEFVSSFRNTDETVTQIEQCPFFMDGGNVKSFDGTLYVGPKTIQHNLQRAELAYTEENVTAMIEKMSAWFSQEVQILGSFGADLAPYYEQPFLHLDLCMTPLGNNKVAVGDLDMAIAALTSFSANLEEAFSKELSQTLTHIRQTLGDPTLELSTLRERTMMHFGMVEALFEEYYTQNELPKKRAFLDSIVEQLSAKGYEIVRIPLVPGMGNNTFVTYNNGLVETQGDQQTMYMPQFAVEKTGPIGTLDALAVDAISDAGIAVRPVQTGFENTINGGSLNCRIMTQREK